MCIYICIYIYIYLYIYVHAHTNTYTHTHTHIIVYIHIYIYICIYLNIYIYIHLFTCNIIYICVYLCIYNWTGDSGGGVRALLVSATMLGIDALVAGNQVGHLNITHSISHLNLANSMVYLHFTNTKNLDSTDSINLAYIYVLVVCNESSHSHFTESFQSRELNMSSRYHELSTWYYSMSLGRSSKYHELDGSSRLHKRREWSTFHERMKPCRYRYARCRQLDLNSSSQS